MIVDLSILNANLDKIEDFLKPIFDCPIIHMDIMDGKFVKELSQRSKHGAPPDGHWRFIVLCAELAQNGLYISDIKVDWLELQNALYEAKCFTASEQVRRNYADKRKASYNARDVLNLKTTFGL